MSNARPQFKPGQNLYEANRYVQALAQGLRADGISMLIIAGIFIEQGLRCLSEAGVSRGKARDIAVRLIGSVKWRNPF